MLDEADFQLGDIMDRMKRLDVYEPIMHFGWTQATWPDEQTEAIPLQRLAPPPAGLDGALTLYLSRYLHLVVDLQLEASDVMVIQQDEVERLATLRQATCSMAWKRSQQGCRPIPHPGKPHPQERRATLLRPSEIRGTGQSHPR